MAHSSKNPKLGPVTSTGAFHKLWLFSGKAESVDEHNLELPATRRRKTAVPAPLTRLGPFALRAASSIYAPPVDSSPLVGATSNVPRKQNLKRIGRLAVRPFYSKALKRGAIMRPKCPCCGEKGDVFKLNSDHEVGHEGYNYWCYVCGANWN